MKKFLFFDTTWNQLLRIGNMVAKELKVVADVETYGLVYETSGKDVNPDKDVNEFDNCLVTTKLTDIEDYIFRVHPDIVVFAQNTIPDLATILY